MKPRLIPMVNQHLKQQHGLTIARRTITKYRVILNFLSARLRHLLTKMQGKDYESYDLNVNLLSIILK